MVIRYFAVAKSLPDGPCWASGRKVRRGSVRGPPAVGSSGDSMKKAPRLLLAGVAVLVGVASASVGRAENLSSAGTVTAVAGPVTVARLSATPQPLKFRDTLFWRDVVEARKDGTARMLLAGKTTVTVRELSRLELREEVMPEGIT